MDTVLTLELVPIGSDLGDLNNISWIVGGWSIASSVSFSMAGAVSVWNTQCYYFASSVLTLL
jgi:hypothetical protein